MAFLLGLLIWFIALALALPFFTDWWPLPDTITEHARLVDAQYYLTLWVAGLIFLLAQLALGYAIFKFGGKRSGPASHIRGNDRWELLWTTAATVLFVGLTFMGYTVWAEARFTEAASARPADDRLTIEVVGQQFVWNIRYPGPDGKFGPTDIKLIDDALGNPLGVDRDHADGKDDIVVPRMAVPVNREIELLLRSKDVLHDFFVPEMRIKLDTVPGITGILRFKADKTGTYEIVCAELCGLGHYEMTSFLDVMEPAAYENWLDEQASYLE